MISLRSVRVPACTAFLLGLSTGAALAAQSAQQFAQAYYDLPGVRAEDPLRDPPRVACEQVFVDRWAPFESSRGPGYDTVYKCREGDGGPVFRGSRLPPSLERQKRGLNY
ncbi:hypothetical protein [Sinorhizobium mexicanum]|uniref:Uncharacterized protein n=1 Tax=Sinorhizobium mexicanum TaxID=375549 RepID=A0A859QBJ8_9HYPH|nr:hypothetical protein [Sinorhizobium mexicanum]MBP1887184.1 hypothetical protein [Sinorhizobium mexicanum]QLL60223.1 hypothetical protein FKV68_01585 [Sinorhizobium mexicanum]